MGPTSSKTTVLVVDDEPGILNFCRGCLAGPGTRVLTAPDGPKALEILTETRIEVLLTDYSMPGMSGADLLERVREAYPRTVQILFTGLGDCRIAEQAVRRGRLFRFLVKPFDRETLREAVDAAVAELRRAGGGGRRSDALPVPEESSGFFAISTPARVGLDAYLRQAWRPPTRRKIAQQELERLLAVAPSERGESEQ